MKNNRKELWINTSTRVAFVNITGQVQESIEDSGVQEGLVLVHRRIVCRNTVIRRCVH